MTQPEILARTMPAADIPIRMVPEIVDTLRRLLNQSEAERDYLRGRVAEAHSHAVEQSSFDLS